MDSVKIIGIRCFPSSKNKDVMYYNYYYVRNYNDYELSVGACYGQVSGVEFSTVDIGAQVGDEVIFNYIKGFQDKAQLVGCQIVKPAK